MVTTARLGVEVNVNIKESPVVSGMESPVVSGMESPVVSGMVSPVVSGMESQVVSGVESPVVQDYVPVTKSSNSGDHPLGTCVGIENYLGVEG